MPEDVEWALEYQRWEKAICSGCGHPLDESMDPEFEGAYDAEWVVCHACSAKEALSKETGDTAPRGGRVVAVLPEGRREVIAEFVENQRKGVLGG